MIKTVEFTFIMAFCLTIFVGGLYVKAIKSENALLRQKTKIAQAEAATYQRELELNRQAMEKWKKQKDDIETATETLKKEIEEAFKHDTCAKNWSTEPIPDSILKRLR